MSNEIRLAFEHPSERSHALADGGGNGGADSAPLDRISLRDHIVEVEIGAFQIERGINQRICFNIVVEVRPVAQSVDDDVDRILSYDKVTEAIAAELADERLNLLETLAERIAERILLEPQALRVFVRIEKLDRGPGALGVEIVRANEDSPTSDTDIQSEEKQHPVLVYLSNAALASPYLKGWLDQLQGQSQPVILCVGTGECAIPHSNAALAQRRIDLLAIEQNAWVLAGVDARCVVVETRTELDWAMKNNQISVWAPSKIILDAVDASPAETGQSGASLAYWLATHIDAERLICVGMEAPTQELPNGSIPVRAAPLAARLL